MLRKHKKKIGLFAGTVLSIHFAKVFGIVLIEDMIILKIGATAWSWIIKLAILAGIAFIITHGQERGWI